MDWQTLLLTHSYLPHEVVSWQQAVCLLYLDKAHVIAEYDDEVSSPSTTIKVPSILVLKRKVVPAKCRVKFSRINIYTRDGFACAYCGQRLPTSKLTYDHVTPRARGGATTWENIVTACYPCNSRKANRTPAEAGLAMRRKPYKPSALPLAPLRLDVARVPPGWLDFCPGTV